MGVVLSIEKGTSLVTKKTFDLALLVVLLAHPAFGILAMASKRWVTESSGPIGTVGQASQIMLAGN